MIRFSFSVCSSGISEGRLFLQTQHSHHIVVDIGIVLDTAQFTCAGTESKDRHHDGRMAGGGIAGHHFTGIHITSVDGEAAGLVVGGDDNEGVFVAGGKYCVGRYDNLSYFPEGMFFEARKQPGERNPVKKATDKSSFN